MLTLSESVNTETAATTELLTELGLLKALDLDRRKRLAKGESFEPFLTFFIINFFEIRQKKLTKFLNFLNKCSNRTKIFLIELKIQILSKIKVNIYFDFKPTSRARGPTITNLRKLNFDFEH